MLRITLGIIILLGLANQFLVMQAPVFGSNEEMQGYVAGQIAFVALAIWLIYSGIRKRKIKKGRPAEEKRMGFINFFKSYFGDYKSFLHKNIELKKPPYWLFIIWAYGVVRLLIRLDATVFERGTDFGIQGWFALWVASLILGAVLGFIGYWVIGSIFHLGVLLAGGRKKAKVSRMIYFYAGLPHSIVVIIIFFVSMLALRENYFLMGGLVPSWLYLATAAWLYSIILAYIGVREIQKTEKIRSILLFIGLPLLLHVSMYAYYYLQT